LTPSGGSSRTPPARPGPRRMYCRRQHHLSAHAEEQRHLLKTYQITCAEAARGARPRQERRNSELLWTSITHRDANSLARTYSTIISKMELSQFSN
jgi:hypothetical protein